MKILVTGASGFIGQALLQKLLSENHEINILTRNSSSPPPFFLNPKIKIYEWPDFRKLPPVEAIADIDGVINLMGENISSKRWSKKQKEKIYDSRIIGTSNLVKLIDENKDSPLEFFITSSAIGIYPTNQNIILDEESPFGSNFLAKLCQDWEGVTLKLKKTKRVVAIRTSVVLEKHGGALAKMLLPFQLGLGGPIGNGNQFMSWIDLDDLINIFIFAINDSTCEGPINGTAPHPIDNFHFTKALGKALGRPTLFPIPKTALRLALGEMSSLLLDSQKVVSKKLSAKNFIFQYETIESSLDKICKNQKKK